MDLLKKCNLCPRKCGVNRYENMGFCKAGTDVRIARAALHYMEEPCISGKGGSGTVFFSGCNLKCCYCQNHELSHDNFGRDISIKRLSEIFLELQDKGANNINLVTGVMYVPHIISALDIVKNNLKIPVVYNSGGYESAETIIRLKEYIDIYLVDIKYYNDDLAKKYSYADNYFEKAIRAVAEMVNQKGEPVFFDGKVFDDEEALLKSGVIIRHLVLPGMRKDSMRILNELSNRFNKKDYLLSLMSQFTPHYRCSEYSEINRRITSFEYDSVVNEALRLGLDNTYIQDRDSVGEEYTPDFDLCGVE